MICHVNTNYSLLILFTVKWLPKHFVNKKLVISHIYVTCFPFPLIFVDFWQDLFFFRSITKPASILLALEKKSSRFKKWESRHIYWGIIIISLVTENLQSHLCATKFPKNYNEHFASPQTNALKTARINTVNQRANSRTTLTCKSCWRVLLHQAHEHPLVDRLDTHAYLTVAVLTEGDLREKFFEIRHAWEN